MENSNSHIDRIHNPSTAEFNKEYGFKFKPVLITGLTDHWRAKEKWTNSFFSNETGHYQEVGVRVKNRNEKKIFTVREYFDYMLNNTDNDPYYLKNCRFHLKAEMKNDYSIPDYFKSSLDMMIDRLPMDFQLSWLYIGSKNTFSGLHLDIYNTSAWNAVVTGKKLWYFFPPEQAKYLYRGAVNPFEPDFAMFPEFAKAKPLICVQKEGEIVFTPSGWWHAVLNKEGGVSVTENFINEINYDFVKMTLLHNGKIQEAQIVDACMTEFRKQMLHSNKM